MYHIVIGDDDTDFLKQTVANAEQAMERLGLIRGEDFEITGYDKPELLRNSLLSEPGRCQFLFLDVEFADQNGMELAKLLRASQKEFSLVYVTSYRDYVFDCFETRPLWYFVKPVDWMKLAELLQGDYLERCQKAALGLKINGRTLNLPYREIYALEAAAHHVRIWLSNQTRLEWNGPLSKLELKLSGGCFCKCHNSYLINLTHVSEVLRDKVLMDNTMSFPVSRRFYSTVLQQFFSLLKK